MAQPVHHVFTFADYVLIEEDSPIRHDGTYPDASVVSGALELESPAKRWTGAPTLAHSSRAAV